MGKKTQIASEVVAEQFVKRAKGERFTRSQVGLQENMVLYFSRLKGAEILVLPENKYALKFGKLQREVHGVGEVEKVLCAWKFGEEIPKEKKISEFWKTSISREKVPGTIGMGYEIIVPVEEENGTVKFRILKNIYQESANWLVKGFKKQEPKVLENFF